MSTPRCMSSLLIVLASALVAPSVAAAQHPELRRARALFGATEFEQAFAVLEAVPDDAGFQRDDVVTWLVLRARIASALGDDALAARELARLATLVDEVALPPDLDARFDAIASTVPPLEVELRWGEGALEAITALDDEVLVRDVRVTVLERGEERAGSSRLAVTEPSRCRAEVIGPGGAVLASASGCPVRPGALEAAPAPTGGDDGLWIALGVTAGAVVVAAAIVIGVFVGMPPGDVNVGSVVVRW